MRKRAKKKAEKREDFSQAAVRVINTVIRKHEGDGASLTDDPNVVKMPKSRSGAPGRVRTDDLPISSRLLSSH